MAPIGAAAPEMNSIKQARILLKNYRLKPNKSEQKFLKLLDEWFPGKLIFNEGQLTIYGKIPDFVRTDKHKVIIELIGRRDFDRHSDEALEEKERLYSRLGFRTMFVDQRELQDEDKLFEDILFFTHSTEVSSIDTPFRKEQRR